MHAFTIRVDEKQKSRRSKNEKTVYQMDPKQSTELHANLIRHAMLILSSSLIWQASWLN